MVLDVLPLHCRLGKPNTAVCFYAPQRTEVTRLQLFGKSLFASTVRMLGRTVPSGKTIDVKTARACC